MGFHSILLERPDHTPSETVEPPCFFVDLNLDQVVHLITAGFEEYEITPLFYARLNDLDAISYRHEIMQDLDQTIAMQAVKSFSERMRLMRAYLDQSQRFHYYRHAMTRRFLAAVEVYCDAVERLTHDLSAFDAKSRGLRAFRDYLSEYVASIDFCGLVTEAGRLKQDLSVIAYSLLIRNGSVTVRHFNSEADYSVSVEETFAKFRQGLAANHWVEIPRWSGMNHIEAQVQDRVALLHPSVFASLETFAAAHAEYLDPKIAQFDREVQFYIAYLTYISKFRAAGLSFCQPILSQTSKDVVGRDTFDIALAGKLVNEKMTVVRNDFFLRGCERILVISGPNQGGKTTLARTFGQLHYLASLGCFVPGKEAQLFLFDRLFTHFERAENPTNLRGKLQDDLVRIRQILDEATPNSILIMNEIFSSTTVRDAVYLSKKIIGRMSALDLIGICVTFLDELASFNEKTVSMVSAVDPNNPTVRTYKVERRPADGLAYALAIAQKYRVTYDWIKERVKV
jgi:DNA mismatch repair protein MutS